MDGGTARTRARLSRRAWVLIGTGLLLGLLGVLCASPLTTRALASQTRVTWDGPVHCTGTEVVPRAEDGVGPHLQYMTARSGMECHRPVRIENRGVVPLTVEDVRLPFVGPGGGIPVQVRSFAGLRPVAEDQDVPHPADEVVQDDRTPPIDAVFVTGWRLRPGTSRKVDVTFEFRPQHCNYSEGWFWAGDFPHVTFGLLGREWAQAAPTGLGVYSDAATVAAADPSACEE